MTDSLTSKKEFSAEYIAEVVQHLESRGWKADSRGDPQCYDEACAAGADIIQRLQQRVADLQQRLDRSGAALARLGSSEAFAEARVIDPEVDRELVLRMAYARRMLADEPVQLSQPPSCVHPFARLGIDAGGAMWCTECLAKPLIIPVPFGDAETKDERPCVHRWTLNKLRNPRPDDKCDECDKTWGQVQSELRRTDETKECRRCHGDQIIVTYNNNGDAWRIDCPDCTAPSEDVSR